MREHIAAIVWMAEDWGGRAKRYFRVEPDAVRLLQESRRMWSQMADGLDDVLGT